MKHKAFLTAVIWLAAAFSAQAAAPTPKPVPPQRQPGVEDMVTRLTKELGLSKKQSDSISAIMTKTRAEMSKIYASKETDEAKRKKMMAVQAESQKKVMAVLTSEQRKKLEQMRQSYRPAGPAMRPGGMQRGPGFANHLRSILKDLKLTSTQKSKTEAALKDFENKADAVKSDPKTTFRQKQEKMHGLRKAAMAKITAALNADQQKKLKEQMPQFFARPGAKGK